MSPKIPPFPPREFATIDEVPANIPAGVAQDAPLVPSSRADVPGKVYIAGGGPGALDLLTLRAVRALGEADVVLLDHLAPQELAEYAPNALIIDVGKVPGKHAVPQSRIQQLMIDYALAGKTVVRLKGGDPYVYGRGAEELDACFAAGLDAEVIPGITSAIAVPAQASIPVTLRKVSSIFTVVSGHSGLDETDIQAVVSTLRAHGTVVLLMGVRTLPDTIEQMMSCGVESDMPLATIEKGFTDQERVIVTTLQQALQDCRDVKSPAITVIGEVVYYARDDRHQFISHVHERLREQSTS